MSCDIINEILNSSDAVLLDVRTEVEYNVSHIEGSLSIPLNSLSNCLHELKDKRVYVYCHTGIRSARATNMLLSTGLEAYNLGGINQFQSCLN